MRSQIEEEKKLMSTTATVASLKALESLDSRGNPTLYVTAVLSDGATGSAFVPSGASTGEHEAHELRDEDPKRYGGKGVLEAARNVDQRIAPKIKGMKVEDQRKIDATLIELDGTENKRELGANAILGVSLAVAHAAAASKKIPLFLSLGGDSAKRLPIPLVNVINGGAHAGNALDFQEFMIVPHTSDSFAENIRAAAEVFHALKKQLAKQGLSTGLGDEGGFAPDFRSLDQAMDALIEAIRTAGYEPGKDISLALDVAASEFYEKSAESYKLKKSSGKVLTSEELIELYAAWAKSYPLVSIEDGLDQNDWNGWIALTSRLGKELQLVGDDLFVTNTKKISEGIERGAGNAVLIKLNQIGTLTETLDSINLAHQNGYRTIISHRSGETEDSTIADLAVATGAGQIKTGSVCRGERTAKYNRLLWIEQYLDGEGYCENPF